MTATGAAMADNTLVLNSLRLRSDGELRREMPLPPARQHKNYSADFDALTVFYDCFYDDRLKQVVIVCPRLLNLWPIIRKGLTLDNQRICKNVRRKKYLRLEILRISVPARPKTVGLHAGGEYYSASIGNQTCELFAGRNCLIAISKNNPLEWIVDWARYHASAHGADAVILFDNGSSIYSADEVQARITAIPGIASCRVVSAPFPYGPHSGIRGRFGPVIPTKFLQASLFNVAQLRFLATARAVLSVDIDELVWPIKDGSIFDAAVDSRFGMVSFFGRWVYPAAPSDKVRHESHQCRNRNDKRGASPKWCVTPRGIAGRFSWATHRPGGAFYPFTISWKLGFWHFFSCSTNWKFDRSKPVDNLVRSNELVSVLARHLGKPNQGFVLNS